MRNYKIILAFSAILAASPAVSASAAPVTPQEASVVAETWLQFILLFEGGWGGYAEGFVDDPQTIAPQGTVVGYFFAVQPIGYIVVPSDNREAPVKVWSDECNLDPDAPGGMAALIRDRLVALHALLNPVPQAAPQAGAAPAQPALEIDYGPAWNWMLGAGPAPLPPPLANYANGQILTTTQWHQRAPYNNDCPYLGCTDPTNGRAVVGCVATAGAQIMRYWYWPPYGVGSPYNDAYDWVNMPDNATTGSPAAQQAAVAELSHEIGVAVSMDYGCGESGGSGANTYDMEGVFENHYRYSTACVRYDRPDYTAAGWFALISTDLNRNRPIQYRIPGHSVVCDGWRISGGQNQYHINYGWSGGSNTAWYAVDAITGGNPPDEYVVECIYPAVALGNSPSGTYTRDASFPYRYFDQDATSTGATFSPGQFLQFLPMVTVECASSTIRFESSASLTTRLFTRADTARGIYLTGGTIVLRGGGGLRQP
jgi:hypothetical protein